LSAGNATLACGYEGSAFQAAVLNTLPFGLKKRLQTLIYLNKKKTG
jgi:hypothetical protein